MKASELKEDLDALSRDVKAQFQEVKAQFDGVNARFEAMGARFDAFTHEIREEIAREGAATRRHFDVVAESIKADVAPFMNRMATLDERVAIVRSEHTTYKTVLENHEIRLLALERHRA